MPKKQRAISEEDTTKLLDCADEVFKPSNAWRIPDLILQAECNTQVAQLRGDHERAALSKMMAEGLRQSLQRREASRAFLFKQQQGESLNKVVGTAKNGSDSALFKLIEWDKSYLFLGWVKKRILDAQGRADSNFFYRLGLSIRKLTGYHKKEFKYQQLRELLRKLHKHGIFVPKGAREVNAIRRWLAPKLTKALEIALSKDDEQLADKIQEGLDAVLDYQRFRKFFKQTAL